MSDPVVLSWLDIENARLELSHLMATLDKLRAWIPRCPRCGHPLTQKLASNHLYCPRCKTEYRLEPI